VFSFFLCVSFLCQTCIKDFVNPFGPSATHFFAKLSLTSPLPVSATPPLSPPIFVKKIPFYAVFSYEDLFRPKLLFSTPFLFFFGPSAVKRIPRPRDLLSPPSFSETKYAKTVPPLPPPTLFSNQNCLSTQAGAVLPLPLDPRCRTCVPSLTSPLLPGSLLHGPNDRLPFFLFWFAPLIIQREPLHTVRSPISGQSLPFFPETPLRRLERFSRCSSPFPWRPLRDQTDADLNLPCARSNPPPSRLAPNN